VILGPVAQRLEQGTHNPLVVGSNPTGPTIFTSFAEAPLMEDWFNQIRELAKNCDGDAAHDFAHLERVTRQAERLTAEENADWAIVMPAAYLHDCVFVPKSSPDRCRASRLAAVRAIELLEGIGYPKQYFAAIHHCIEAHSFSAGLMPETIEAKVLQDADRLDALGAIGIARCLITGGSLNRELYSPEDPLCEVRSPDEGTYTIDHFFTKLLGLSATMQTKAGRAEADRRSQFMISYLDQLGKEIR
jgi:uncharacterized protein